MHTLNRPDPQLYQLLAERTQDYAIFLLDKEGNLAVNLEDEVVAGSLLTHAGKVTHPATAERLATSGVPA